METTETALKVGDPAPDFTLPSTSHGELTLSQFGGKKVLVAFYPRYAAQYQELFAVLARIE